MPTHGTPASPPTPNDLSIQQSPTQRPLAPDHTALDELSHHYADADIPIRQPGELSAADIPQGIPTRVDRDQAQMLQ